MQTPSADTDAGDLRQFSIIKDIINRPLAGRKKILFFDPGNRIFFIDTAMMDQTFKGLLINSPVETVLSWLK